MDGMDIIEIARAAHEANRRFCLGHGDPSQVPWDEAPYWQKSNYIKGVEMLRDHPDAGPGDLHRGWLAEKEATGWVYGLVKDAQAKTHPCMVAFEELPLEQQLKDHLFVGVVRALLGDVGDGEKVAQGVPRSDLENRFTYHPPKGDQPDRYECIRGMAWDVARYLEQECPASRELSLALTKLEEVVFWANAAIARNE